MVDAVPLPPNPHAVTWGDKYLVFNHCVLVVMSLLCVRILVVYEFWWCTGKKFAVGTGNRQVVVCCYDDVENWWVPKTKRVHKSSVLSLAWNPDNLTLATCGTDGRVAVCSGYIKEVDGSANAPPRQPG